MKPNPDITELLAIIEFQRRTILCMMRGATDETPMQWVRSNLRSLLACVTAKENPRLKAVVERTK